MAELLGGAFLGAGVAQLLTSLIDAVNKFKHRNESVLHLQERLERLKPLVEALEFVQTESGHPAGKWLCDLHQQLRKAYELVAKSQGRIKRILESENLDKINERISELLTDSLPVQLAEQRQLRQQVAQALTSASPHLREKEIKLATRQLEYATRNIVNDASSSSTTVVTKPHWSRACDIPDPPRIAFGGTAVADTQFEDILHGEYKKWIVMWGMGGVGKTFTARKVFHDASISQHFTGGTYWVTVSKDQPPPQQILKQLYEKIKGGRAPFDFPDNAEEARFKVRSSLNKDRILLVLDDVWESSALEYLDVVSEEREGVTLVTTRDQGTLDFVSGDDDGKHRKKIAKRANIVEILRLSTEDSWQLFSWHAFDVYGESVSGDLETIARDVAQECKGLPLALKVIGSTMGRINLSLPEEKLGLTLRGKWQKALEQLRSMSHYKDEYESLYQKLQWSVDNLVSQDSRLKDCFFYFGAYPEDYPVPVEELVSIWVAEGLCGEDEAKILLASLVAKSMIELTGEGKSCKTHDIMRDLIHRDLNFEKKRESHISQRKCLYAPTSILGGFPDDWTAPDVTLSAERLSIQGSSLEKLPHKFNAPSLRVLMLGNMGDSDSKLHRLPPGFFQNLSCLKVLVLSGTSIRRVPGSVLRNLKELVLLDLTNCGHLIKVSDDLDRLQNLETILLEGCLLLRRLPQMKSLTKLHSLSVHLPTLYLPRFCCPTARGAACEFFLNDWIDRTRHAWPASPFRGSRRFGLPNVVQLCGLRRLTVSDGRASGNIKWRLPDVASLSALEELKIKGVQQTHASLVGLHNLRVLQITWTMDTTMPPLDEFPLLEELSIVRCPWIESLPESFGRDGAFPCLRKLIMTGMWGLRTRLFTFHVGSMPKLETLTIGELGWGRSIEFPVSLTTLTTLKSLCLHVSSFVEVDFNLLFREPNCFPDLERLGFDLAVAATIREKLPQHILEREAPRGKLKIEEFKYFSTDFPF